MTWTFDTSTTKDFRKDLTVGMEGTILGFADIEHRQVLLKIALKGDDKKKHEVTHGCYPGNLTRTSEYKLKKAGEKAAKASQKADDGNTKEDDGKKKRGPPAWILLGSAADQVRVEISWVSEVLLSKNDQLSRSYWLKSRLGVCLEQLCTSLPTYGAKDFYIANRQTEKGVWVSELWTARAFAAEEVLLGPLSSQIKDTHIHAQQHACISLPKHGRGSHPAQQELAICGRSRLQIAKPGSIDKDGHKGVLFFCVGRTSTLAEANMSLEEATFEMTCVVHLPVSKKKRTSEDGQWKSPSSIWSPSDLPGIPMLLNKKALPEKVRLMAFQVLNKRNPYMHEGLRLLYLAPPEPLARPVLRGAAVGSGGLSILMSFTIYRHRSEDLHEYLSEDARTSTRPSRLNTIRCDPTGTQRPHQQAQGANTIRHEFFHVMSSIPCAGRQRLRGPLPRPSIADSERL